MEDPMYKLPPANSKDEIPNVGPVILKVPPNNLKANIDAEVLVEEIDDVFESTLTLDANAKVPKFNLPPLRYITVNWVAAVIVKVPPARVTAPVILSAFPLSALMVLLPFPSIVILAVKFLSFRLIVPERNPIPLTVILSAKVKVLVPASIVKLSAVDKVVTFEGS